MKTKILFMLTTMNVGGTERAFLNLLEELPKEKYEITLLLLEKKGDFLKELPAHITIKVLKEFKAVKHHLSYNPKHKMNEFLRQRLFKKALFLFCLHAFMKITKDRRIFFRQIFKNIPSQSEQYDIAVAYSGPMDFITYYIARKVNASSKIQWIHFDVRKIGFDRRFAANLYKSFNSICIVSEKAKLHMTEKVPSAKDKMKVQLNRINEKRIKELAEEVSPYFKKDHLRIITVGRIAEEKGPDLAIQAATTLYEKGYSFSWHWIGEGIWEDHVRSLIKENNMEEVFILEGVSHNPYKYIAYGDIYVQPSRHEGYCLTLAEAKILKKPIIATDFTGAREQLEHGVTGLIAETNVDSLEQMLEKLVESSYLRKQLSEALNQTKYTGNQDFKILERRSDNASINPQNNSAI